MVENTTISLRPIGQIWLHDREGYNLIVISHVPSDLASSKPCSQTPAIPPLSDSANKSVPENVTLLSAQKWLFMGNSFRGAPIQWHSR